MHAPVNIAASSTAGFPSRVYPRRAHRRSKSLQICGADCWRCPPTAALVKPCFDAAASRSSAGTGTLPTPGRGIFARCRAGWYRCGPPGSVVVAHFRRGRPWSCEREWAAPHLCPAMLDRAQSSAEIHRPRRCARWRHPLRHLRGQPPQGLRRPGTGHGPEVILASLTRHVRIKLQGLCEGIAMSLSGWSSSKKSGRRRRWRAAAVGTLRG